MPFEALAPTNSSSRFGATQAALKLAAGTELTASVHALIGSTLRFQAMSFLTTWHTGTPHTDPHMDCLLFYLSLLLMHPSCDACYSLHALLKKVYLLIWYHPE
jgi:hypothetical protein